MEDRVPRSPQGRWNRILVLDSNTDNNIAQDHHDQAPNNDAFQTHRPNAENRPPTSSGIYSCLSEVPVAPSSRTVPRLMDILGKGPSKHYKQTLGSTPIGCATGHDQFEKVLRKNAKCDICDRRNGSVIQKCSLCGLSTCSECHRERRYDSRHRLVGLDLDWTAQLSSHHMAGGLRESRQEHKQVHAQKHTQRVIYLSDDSDGEDFFDAVKLEPSYGLSRMPQNHHKASSPVIQGFEVRYPGRGLSEDVGSMPIFIDNNLTRAPSTIPGLNPHENTDRTAELVAPASSHHEHPLPGESVQIEGRGTSFGTERASNMEIKFDQQSRPITRYAMEDPTSQQPMLSYPPPATGTAEFDIVKYLEQEWDTNPAVEQERLTSGSLGALEIFEACIALVVIKLEIRDISRVEKWIQEKREQAMSTED